MNVVGIIAEYNPFHKGHAYQIQKAKEQCGAEFAVVVMNGDFVQRGEPAIFDKYTRTKEALLGGADLIFELPVRFGLSSAGDFAMGGILALNALPFVTHLCFGTETGDLTPLLQAASFLCDEPDSYRTRVKHFIKQGILYPKARSLALAAESGLPTETWDSPNNILGLEYCVALQKLHSKIKPFTIRREGQGYHDNDTPALSDFPSATFLRKQIRKAGEKENLSLSDFSSLIGYSLLTAKDLCRIKDITPDLSDRIRNELPKYREINEFVKTIKNPSLTTGRIKRSFFQCLFDIEKEEPVMPYLRVLGMKKEASSLLSQKENASCQILTKLAFDVPKMDDTAKKLFAKDLLASDLYRQVFCHKYNQTLPNEYQHSPIVL
ncbi:nucleotidyltransferase [Clostridium sp. AF37-5]|jgi:cytidyltransferase-like protein|uniref:tRNA(Met) cytidine acetate ligase n=1 Tax=Clostridium sp. AF37-5 TaxID=2293016 RepID=UPI000E4DA0C0|nr:nucleotidyltransferase family protein [Clostridium sp. AF37-5]MBS5668772.1 nucleotidyltransferase family protein [Clostridium sp.]RHO98256.1 nucleotidyltransferase [Clostridium sp. AF37-5]